MRLLARIGAEHLSPTAIEIDSAPATNPRHKGTLALGTDSDGAAVGLRLMVDGSSSVDP